MASYFSRVAVCAALLSATALVAPAQAQYTVSNSNGGDGYLTTASSPYTWMLVGANNDADSNIVTASAVSGGTQNVTFNYSYQTFDEDGSSYDPAGYFVNSNFFQLTSCCTYATQTGTFTLSLNAGDTYGFYVNSTDGCCGPGAISFAQSGVPEPASWALMLGGFGAIGGAMRSRRKTAVSFG